MPIVIAHKAEHGILHIVGVIITATIAAVNGGGGLTVRLSLSLSVHHVEQYTGNPTCPQEKRNSKDRVRNPSILLAKAWATTPPLFLLTALPCHAIIPATARSAVGAGFPCIFKGLPAHATGCGA
jgi:hypothetical protein